MITIMGDNNAEIDVSQKQMGKREIVTHMCAALLSSATWNVHEEVEGVALASKWADAIMQATEDGAK